jgi:hypothetical protein
MPEVTETRHYHGNIWHDHDGGDEPHTHKLGDRNLIGPRPDSSGGGASAAFGFGTVALVIGILLAAVEQSNHDVCSSGMALGSCQGPDGIWTIGVALAAIGVVLLIVGAILRGKS